MPVSTQRLVLAPSDKRWGDFVDSRPESSVFQHPAWSNVLAECYGYVPMMLAVCGADGAVHAGCPMMELKHPFRGKRWVALPFSDHCAPLYDDVCDLETLVQWLTELCRAGEVAGIEIRWKLPIASIVHATTYDVLSRVRLDPDSAVVATRFHNHHVRQLKKAQKNDALRVERGTGAEHLQQFYRLHVRTRQRLGLPVQPRRFFRLLGDYLMKPGLGFVGLVYDGDECVAADVFLHWQKTLTYKYSANSDAARNTRANYLLMWDAIQWGCDNGYTWLDLGRSAQSNVGLRTFKARWGAEETPLTYMSLPSRPADPRQSKLMPIVQSVIRHSPIWMCKVMGELFYKYVG